LPTADSSAAHVTPENTSPSVSDAECEHEPRGEVRHLIPEDQAIIPKVHQTTEQLEAMLPELLAAPKDNGRIEMIVRRPSEDEREVVDEAKLDTDVGLVGDNWAARDGTNPDTQLTLMSSRVVSAMAGNRDRWPLAGDQIYVDMDISTHNLPPGTRLSLGEAVIEISDMPHNGCPKFAARFGKDALRFANVGVGKEKRFRGVYARVVEGGTISTGDEITRG